MMGVVTVSLLVRVLQVFVQFLSVFQWCSKCEGEWSSCLVSWVHLQEGPLVIVEGLHHFSETDTGVVIRVPAEGRGRREVKWRSDISYASLTLNASRAMSRQLQYDTL